MVVMTVGGEMRIAILDKITGEWAQQWTVVWFFFGVVALTTVFWLTTEHRALDWFYFCLLYTSPSPRDATLSRMPSSA